jgi:hypothetical protein
MYKDKDKQREANRQAQAKFKAKGITNQGITDRVLPDNFIGGVNLNTKPERTAQGNIRVSKPGDADYVPMCETTKAFIEGRAKRPETGKRGKDIKCFEDLPPDVQEVIHRLSTTDGKIDKTIKANRTAIAVNYQHQFPDRFHSTGVGLTLDGDLPVIDRFSDTPVIGNRLSHSTDGY